MEQIEKVQALTKDENSAMSPETLMVTEEAEEATLTVLAGAQGRDRAV